MSQLSILSAEVKHLLTLEQAWAYKIVPEKIDSSGLHLFIDDKQAIQDIKNELEIVLGKSILLTPVSFEQIEKSLNVNCTAATSFTFW